MHLYYIANIRVPTEKAHGKQTREMCNALASLNVPITLVVTNRKSKGTEGEFGLVQGVEVLRLRVPDTVAWGYFGFLYEYVRFALAVRRFLRSRREDAMVITREYLCAMVAARMGIPTIWESHRPQWNRFARKALESSARMVVVSKGLRDFYDVLHSKYDSNAYVGEAYEPSKGGSCCRALIFFKIDIKPRL